MLLLLLLQFVTLLPPLRMICVWRESERVVVFAAVVVIAAAAVVVAVVCVCVCV